MPKPDLDGAYALNSVDDAKKLYDGWAETYDQSFVEDMDFIAPRLLAEAFVRAGGTSPVLDFGAGTGVVGEDLAKNGVTPIDGADLSEEMLSVARRKGVYRDLVSGNVLEGYQMDGALYAGVVSCGTFTHGHVGPDAIPILLDLAAPGAQFALTIKTEHYHDAGFAAMFDTLGAGVKGLELTDSPIYGARNTGPHKDDRMLITLFRKAN